MNIGGTENVPLSFTYSPQKRKANQDLKTQFHDNGHICNSDLYTFQEKKVADNVLFSQILNEIVFFLKFDSVSHFMTWHLHMD